MARDLNPTPIPLLDIDECDANTDNCDRNAECVNTDGKYTCTCKRGYRGDGYKCTDVNECREGSDRCHAKADCTNTQGSYACQCKNGYTGNGRTCRG